MTKNVQVPLLIGCLLIAALSFADEEAPPRTVVAAPDGGGSCYFKLIPKVTYRKGEVISDLSSGVAYLIEQDGRDKELWRTNGWYSSELYLSRNCRSLVRMGPWASGNEPEPGDLAVAFYLDGKLLKAYSTSDLVKDHAKVLRTSSHYYWMAYQRRYMPPDNNTLPGPEPKLYPNHQFVLVTVDDIEYEFNALTGEIIRAKGSSRSGLGK